MKLPKQLPAVERKVNKLASMPVGGVRPSQSAWPTYNPWLERMLGIARAF